MVALFPEGGSHDQTKILELKVGVAILVYEASIRLGYKVPVCPTGLNYFRGHQFRSRVFVDFGDPIYASDDMLGKYKEAKDIVERLAASDEEVEYQQRERQR